MTDDSQHALDVAGQSDSDFGRRLIRPYAMTKGRTRPTRDIPIETLVRSRTATPPPNLGGEERSILQMTEAPISIAEIAARRGLVLGVVRVLVADLVQSGMVETSQDWSQSTGTRASSPVGPDGAPAPHKHRELLERVLNGLQSL